MMAERIANIGFFFLFPVFFVWHFCRAAGLISIELGLYGEVSLVIALAFLFFFLVRWINLLLYDAYAVAFIFLLFYCTLWTAGAWIAMERSDVLKEAALDSLTLIVSWFALLSIGGFLNVESFKFRAALWISWFVMAGLTLAFTDWRWLMFYPRDYFGYTEGISYQGFSRSFTVTSVLLLALIPVFYKRMIFSLVCAALIFLLGARSELFGFIFCVALLEVVVASKRVSNLAGLVFLTVAGLAVLIINLDALMSSRQLEVLNIEQSSSWVAREDLTSVAIDQISQSPLLGLFGGDRVKESGSYSHNALSAWVTYGFFGFIIYCALAVVALAKSILWVLNKETPMSRFALYLNASALVLIAFAKPVFWPLIALGWGVLINERARHAKAAHPALPSPSLRPAG